MKNVLYGKCVKCGKTYPATPDLTTCTCGGILDIVYDYDAIRREFTKETLAARSERTMWRYRELLPVEETTAPTPLRVGWSPLYEEPRLAEQLGLGRLWVKDDGQNPTASLKDRASAMAVAKAREAGAQVIACSSTGNAASSLAGNAAAAGLETFIFVPSRAPKGKVAQLMTFGATVISVEGSYEETFELSKAAIDRWGWYNRNAAINPYLSEGKKDGGPGNHGAAGLAGAGLHCHFRGRRVHHCGPLEGPEGPVCHRVYRPPAPADLCPGGGMLSAQPGH